MALRAATTTPWLRTSAASLAGWYKPKIARRVIGIWTEHRNGSVSLRVALLSVDDLDDEATELLQRAYHANIWVHRDPPRRASTPSSLEYVHDQLYIWVHDRKADRQVMAWRWRISKGWGVPGSSALA